ncbi:serpin family protein, partial [bacterium]|nr:serpin family protein [candidate division CSSED10-310 bacterium]
LGFNVRIKNFCYVFLFLSSLLICAACFQGDTATTDTGDYGNQELVESHNVFALSLYHNIRNNKGNVVISPYSISTALGMAYAGARGSTQKQMAEVLHFNLDQEKLHSAFKKLQAHLGVIQNKGHIELSIANALWIQKDFHLLEEFLDLMRKNYRAGVHTVNYAEDLESVRKAINAWVKRETKNKIKEIIRHGMLDQSTCLVLTNAIYFRGNWKNQFEKKLTNNAPFYLTQNKSVEVSMMNQLNKFKYFENDSFQIIELPYVGNDLSMIVLLPKKIDGLSEIESSLSTESLKALINGLYEEEVIVFLPRFKVGFQILLSKTLEQMGMRDAFNPGSANFSGINGTRSLYINDIIHKVFLDVHEEGTEAAAATGIVSKSIKPVMRIDHPFLFIIRDNRSGSILFLGKIVNPKENNL